MSRRSPRPAALSLIGLLLFSGGAPTGFAEEPQADPLASLSRAMTEAQQALALGEVEIAESRYRTLLLEGWLLVGSLAVERGDLEEARQAFRLASIEALETRRPRISLALVELQLDNPQEAVSLLRGLKKDHLGDAVIRRLIPRALLAADQVEEGIQEMVELHVLNPADLENTYALARAHLGQRKIEEAAALLQEIAERQPIAATRVLIGRTYRDFEQYERARHELRAALEQDPDIARAHFYLGSVELLDLGQDRLDQAMEHFEAELRVTPEDPLANLYLGIALVERRRHEEAVPRLELASRLVSGRADAFQFLGRAYLALGRVEEAIAALRHGLEIAESAPEPTMVRSAVDFRRRQFSGLHFQLGQALRQSGEHEQAAAHFDAAKEHSARSAEGARELLAAYFQDGDEERSLTASTWPLELTPASGFPPEQRAAIDRAVKASLVRSYFNLGVQRTKDGQFARAAVLYSRASDLDPDFPRLQYALGAALFNAGQYEQATAPLARALDDDPADENLSRMLALAWFNSDGYEQAADLLRDDRGRAANASLQYAYAVALVRSGRAAEAAPAFETLLADNADSPELNVLLGQAHAQQQDFEEAIRYLERSLELDEDVADAHAVLGDIYLRQGRLDEAEEALRTGLSFHPSDTRAAYKLAVVLDLNRKPEAAVGLLRPLLEKQPDLADGRYLLGKILLAQGAAEEARAQLEAAAELAPADANIRYQLGQAYQRLGRPERARHEFAEYRRLKGEGREGTGG